MLVLVLPLVLAGCAANPSKDEQAGKDSSAYGNLYDGDERVAHEAGSKSDASVQEVIQKGDQALARGEIDEALFNYVKALQLGGESADLLNKVGGIHTLNGNLAMAARAYRMSIEADPENALPHEGLGLIMLRERDHGEAAEQLAKAVALDPNRWQSLNGLGLIEDLKGNSAQALEYYSKALAIAPKSPRVHNNLGYSHYLAGNWVAALKHFRLALNYNPQFTKAWSNIGLVYTRQGDYDAALEAFQHVMSKPEAYNDVGYFCMMNGEYGKASLYLQQAIETSPAYYKKAHENLDKLKQLKKKAG